jgi:hypothetical protein
MAIIPQQNLFVWSEIEELGDLEEHPQKPFYST